MEVGAEGCLSSLIGKRGEFEVAWSIEGAVMIGAVASITLAAEAECSTVVVSGEALPARFGVVTITAAGLAGDVTVGVLTVIALAARTGCSTVGASLATTWRALVMAAR
jgi:hypothetical protein